MSAIKWVGGALFGIAMSGYGYISNVQETNAVLAKYNFSEVELSRFKMCQAAMIKANVVFDEASEAGGCGCIVANIRETFPEGQRQVAHELDAFDSWSSGDDYSKEGAFKRKLEIMGKYKTTEADLNMIEKSLAPILDKCSV